MVEEPRYAEGGLIPAGTDPDADPPAWLGDRVQVLLPNGSIMCVHESPPAPETA